MTIGRWALCLSLSVLASAGARASEPELLPELSELERTNSQRRDGALRQAVQHQIVAGRRQLQRAQEGATPLSLALTGLLGNLQAMAAHNQKSEGREQALSGRFSAQVDALRRRTEGALRDTEPPYPAYGLPPASAAPMAAPVVLLRRGVLLATRDVLPPPPFAGLLQQMQLLAFGDEKIRLARDAAQAGVRLTCRQIVKLMETTAFGDEQVEIAAALYLRALDPKGLPDILGALSAPPDRKRLQEKLGR